MNLVPRYDDPRAKTLKVIGQTRTNLQTDIPTMPYHNMSHQRRAYKSSKFTYCTGLMISLLFFH